MTSKQVSSHFANLTRLLVIITTIRRHRGSHPHKQTLKKEKRSKRKDSTAVQ